jgi:peptide/nickel transport system substrate-binding protein
VGDVEKYGPRGSNSFDFQIDQGVPEQYLSGQIATGWVVNTNGSPMTITFNIRHGIMWSGNPNIGMAPRELTADDVVYTFKRSFASPSVQGLYGFVSSIDKPDKYTVVLEISDFNAIWPFYLMDGLFPGNICCPEWGDTTASGGSEAWQNVVSDGPFILTDFVSGSGGTYKKNPNYWQTTTISGKQYKVPFIDTLIYPIIADESTAIAALRTAKIDWFYSVPLTYESSLNSTDLLHVQWTTGKDDTFQVNRSSNQYLKQLAVRQAIIKATDFTTIRDLIYPGGRVFDWPAMQGSEAYVPLNQMPANIQDLWTYDPVKAKQMLSDAGYPNGFSLGINIDATVSTEQDVAQLLASQWAKVGITLNIHPEDPTVLNADLGNYHYDLLYIVWSPGNFINQTNRVLSTAGGATYLASEPFDNLWWTMDKESDPIKRAADEKTLAAAMLNDAGWIPMAGQVADNYWWPWIQNYYKEIETGYENKVPMIERMWIDQSMKTSMGH